MLGWWLFLRAMHELGSTSRIDHIVRKLAEYREDHTNYSFRTLSSRTRAYTCVRSSIALSTYVVIAIAIAISRSTWGKDHMRAGSRSAGKQASSQSNIASSHTQATVRRVTRTAHSSPPNLLVTLPLYSTVPTTLMVLSSLSFH